MGNTPQIPGWTMEVPPSTTQGSPTSPDQGLGDWTMEVPPTAAAQDVNAAGNWVETPPAQIPHTVLQPTNASAPEGFWDRAKNWASGIWDSAPVQLALALSPHQALKNVYGKLPGPVTQKVSDVLGYPIPGVMNAIGEGAHILGNTRLLAPVAGTTPRELEKHLPEGVQQTINDIGVKLEHFIQGNATVGGGLQLGGLIAANLIPAVGEAADADAAANIADEASEAASAVKDATEGAAPPAPGTTPVADPQSAAEGAANAVKDAVEGTPQTPGVPGAPGQPAVEGEPQPTTPAEAAGEPPAPEAPTAPATGEPPSEEDEAEEEKPNLRKLKAPQKPPKEFGPLTKAIARSPVGRYLLEHPNLLKAAKYIKTGADLGFSYEMGKGVISDERGIQEDLKEQNYPKAVADMLGITATGAGAFFGAKEGIGETIGHVFHTDPTALDILRAKHDGDLQLAIAQTHRIAQEVAKLHLSPMDQEAIKFYINAGGEKATLQKWAEQLANVPSGQVNPDVKDVALEAINRAINDTGKLKATADTLTKFLAHIHAEGRAVDYFQKPPRPNYFPQGTAWDDENGNPTVIDEEEGAPVRPPKRGGGTLKDVKSPTLQRIFPTYFDGIMAGQRPSYIPLHTALMEYANDVLPSIATRRFVADLRGTDAGDGRPIAVQGGMVLNPTAEEGPVLVDPRGMPKPHIVQNGFDLPEIGKGEPGNEPPLPKGAIEVKKSVVPEADEPSGPRVEPVAGVLRAHNKFASTLWLSDDAFDELMKHVAQATPGFNTLGYGHIQGIHVPPAILRDILAHPHLSDSLRDLVTDALNYSDYSKGAGIPAVRDSLESPLREVVENEEQAHALQGSLGGSGGALDALSDPASQRALTTQVNFAVKGYNNAAVPVQAAEAGAKLLAGRYNELGLTQSQGDALLNRYIFELEKEHGETKLREAASRAPDEIGRKIIDFLDYRGGGKTPAGASGGDVAEQQPDPLKLLGAREVRETSREIAAQAHATGAAAFNFRDGLIEPRKGFAVPVYPERTEAFPEGAKHSGDMVQRFLEKNRDIFARDPDATLTVLPHPGHGFSLEISHIEDDRGAAVKAAKENRRAGVLDLQINKAVPTGIEAPKPGIEYIRSGADRYNKSERLPQVGGENLPTPKNIGQVAEAYEKLRHQPFDAATKTAYDSLRRDIEHQWDFLTKRLGIKMQPWRGEGEPYASPAEMWQDVEKNHRLRFKDDTNILDTHPLYGINPKSGTTYINMLGALHDVLGHAAAHLGDTLEDRDTAYQRHAQMFSPESRGAFATEIRGRGAAIEAGKDVGPRKAGLLPEELRGRGEADRFPAAKEPIIPKVSTDEERLTRAMLRDRVARQGETEISLSRVGKGEEEPTDLPASSVRDEKGNLRTVYHGTQSPKIFDLKDISFDGPPAPEEDEDGDFIAYGSGNDASAYMGAHFAEEPEVASNFASGNVWNVGGLRGRFDGPDEEVRPRVIPAKLDIRHPMVYDREDDLQHSLMEGKINDETLLDEALGFDYDDENPPDQDEDEFREEWYKRYDEDPEFRAEQNKWILNHSFDDNPEQTVEAARDLGHQLTEKLQAQGYDGVKYANGVEGGTSWIAFEPDQVHSAFPFEAAAKDAARKASGVRRPVQMDLPLGTPASSETAEATPEGADKGARGVSASIGSGDDVAPEVRKAIEDAGAKVNGKMRRLNGKPPLILFTDPKTNDTLALPEDEVSKEAVASKLAAKRAQFEEAKNKNAPGAPKESEQAPVPKVVKETAGAVDNNKPPVKEKPPVAPPSWLRGSKPRFGYGSANYKLNFEDDRDKALYTVAQATKNRMHDAAMEWLRKQFPGDSDGEIRARGMAVRERIKRLAAAEPKSDTLRVAPTGGDVSREDAASKLAAKRAQFEEARKKAAGAGNGNKPPVDEKPPVAPEEQEPPKPNKGRKGAPIFDTSDYKDINHPALRKWKFLASRDGNPILLHADMKIHPDFYGAIKNYVEDGGFESPALRKALQLTTLAKNTKILFAPFHRIQEGARGLIAGLGGTVFHPPDIDPDDPVVSRLLHNSLKLYDPRAAADFGSEGLESETFWKKQIKKVLARHEGPDAKPSFAEATRKWETEGKQNQAVTKLTQGMGKFLGDGLFGPGGYVPRLKAALATKEFQEYMASHPTADPDLVAWQVSHHVNSVFGLMNWKVLGASVKHLDIARLISFAPDFLTSELSLFGGALSGDWRAQKLLLRNVVFQVIATRIATMAFATALHPTQTLKNPLAAMNLQHPMSVKLPNGDLLMPRSPLTDALNFGRNPAQFVEYRTSPLLDAARGAAGRDYAGHKLKGVQARAESVVSSLEPMFMQGIPKTSASDSLGKSFLRGLSLDEYTDYTPAERLAFAYDAGDAGDEPKTAEQKQATMREMKLINGLRPKNLGGRGNLTVADVRQAFKSGKITGKQMLTIMREAEKPAIVAAVTHLTVPQILKVMSVASPQEGIELVPPLLRKLVGLSISDPQQFRALQPLVRQAIKAARVKKAHELIQQ
jgi:hypothetical protein